MKTHTLADSIAGALVAGPHQDAAGVRAAEFRFPGTDPIFAGHFPGRPLLPGVVQIEMARLLLERGLGCACGIRQIEKARFLRPILPGELIRVEVKASRPDATTAAMPALVDQSAGGPVTVVVRVSVQGQPAGELLLRLAQNISS